MGREAVVDRHFASARLVEHRYLDAVAEGRFAGHGYAGRVGDESAVGYVVVGDIVADAVDEHVVAYIAVVDAGEVDSRLHGHVAAARQHLLGGAESYVAGKRGVAVVLRAEGVGNADAGPVVASAGIGFEYIDFAGGEGAVVHRSYGGVG